MKYLIGLLLGVLLHISYAKSTKVDVQKAERSPQDMYNMNCVKVASPAGNYPIYRCQNTELTCYISADTGLQCKI